MIKLNIILGILFSTIVVSTYPGEETNWVTCDGFKECEAAAAFALAATSHNADTILRQ